MILGVDHLALTVTDMTVGQQSLEKEGFVCQFAENNQPNAIEKKRFLGHYQPYHDLALFRPKEGGVAVEITNHGPVVASGRGPYQYYQDHIVLHTPDPQVEQAFWQEALRFRKSGEPNLLKLISPVPDWSCRLKLVLDDTIEPCTLDSAGYPCLALLSNKLDQDSQKIAKAGASAFTEPFSLVVNGKRLEIVLFRTPTGALGELIQVKGK
ncbi:MAG TPA: hypothetical protein VLL52_04895 [Anaerolineae bacterium]|nr:hypothetical protein [Anaerolineae bacterium]